MKIYEYGNADTSIVLVQPVGDHDLPEIEKEIAEIQRLTNIDFRFVAVKVENWNHDLTPWHAPAAFGSQNFGDGAAETLKEIMRLCADKNKRYYIGGYSLAGLFALWTACETGNFQGIAAASPSVWFPGFVEYMKKCKIKTPVVYLSLGNKEEKTKNQVMSRVGDCLRESYTWLQSEGIKCILEWNSGGHFKDPALRTARAFAWVLASTNPE